MLVTIVIKLEQSVVLTSPPEPQSVRKRAHLLSLKSQTPLISSSLTSFDYPARAQLALQVLFEEETVFWSQKQLSAIVTVLETDTNVLICLPTVFEKSLIIFLPAFLIRDRVIIVIVLFVTICLNLQACVSAQSLQSIVFSPDHACKASLIFVTLKITITGSFFIFLY